jgi:hypothetical protein
VIDTDSRTTSALPAVLLVSNDISSAGALIYSERRRQQVFALRYDEKNNLLQRCAVDRFLGTQPQKRQAGAEGNGKLGYPFAGHTTQISVLAYGNTNYHPSCDPEEMHKRGTWSRPCVAIRLGNGQLFQALPRPVEILRC